RLARRLALVGAVAVLSTPTTLRRLYPVIAHFRYALESIRVEIRQYFIEDDLAEVPFSREKRALVYQRSKNERDTVPFGSEHDPYSVSYEWINHSLVAAHAESHDFRVLVGGSQSMPYDASVF